MADQPLHYSRLSNWLAGHLGYRDLFKDAAELRQVSEKLREHSGMLAALTEGQGRQLERQRAEINRQEEEIARLTDQLEDCNHRLAEVRENGSERIAPGGPPNE